MRGEEDRGGPDMVLIRRRKMVRDLTMLRRHSQIYVEIDLSENLVEEITAIGQLSFRQLVFLDLSNNLIVSLLPLARTALPSLSRLYLHGNRIPTIGPLALTPLPRLQELRLGGTSSTEQGYEIDEVQCLRECQWPELARFYLDSNDIASVAPLCKVAFQKLTHPYLGHNQLVGLDWHCLCRLSALEVLSLRGNRLTSCRFLARSCMPQLQHINLHSSLLPELGPALSQAHLPQLGLSRGHACLQLVPTYLGVVRAGLDQTGLLRVRLVEQSSLNLSENCFAQLNEVFGSDQPRLSVILHSSDEFVYRARVEAQPYQKFIAEAK